MGFVLRYHLFVALFLGAFVVHTPIQAQQATIEPVPVELTETGKAYRKSVGRRADTEIIYVESYEGDLLGGTAAKKRPEQDFQEPVIKGNLGIILVLAVLVVGILLFFYFGGGGALLSGAPGEFKRKREARAEWELDDDLSADGYEALLKRLAAASDRTDALVKLLRYSLVVASEATGVLFARSDTEREALRRLPPEWITKTGINALLKEAELAHYGGRSVDQGTFDICLNIARNILTPAGRRNG